MSDYIKNNPNLIDGSPTKQFFLSVMVKDVLIEDAIIDLIDNSIDGARRLRGTGSYDNLRVNLNATANEFLIEDNCGGFDINTARHYALRFGRDKEVKKNEAGIIGEFGVGMKRALLKMGRKIDIESITRTESFKIFIDVDKWIKEKDWEFSFSELKTGLNNADEMCGTKITVSSLYTGISAEFSSQLFLSRLKILVEETQVENINRGLEINVGSYKANSSIFTLRVGKEFKPIYVEKTIASVNGKGQRSKVKVRIYAGVADSHPDSAGWYISCNGRTIISADKSDRTGWGVKEDGSKIPSYHNQYSKFRGYVFLEADDTNSLPWNTTKTSVDTDHPLYRQVKLEMASCMKSVFSFLNAMDRESETGAKPLTAAYQSSVNKSLLEINKKTKIFVWSPVTEKKDVEKLKWIKYQRPVEEVNRAMEMLNVDKPEIVGEKTFDYYMNLEA
jgi:hypothetical protein